MNKTGKTNLSSLVHRRLSEVLLFEINDPRFSNVTISRVEASGNLTLAKVFVSIFPPEGHNELIKSLNNASGFLSRKLGQVLKNFRLYVNQKLNEQGTDWVVYSFINNKTPLCFLLS